MCADVAANGNPFFAKWGTPFEVPDFARIETDHYLPAFEAGIREQRSEVEAIAKASDAATFENTIEALEYSGELLRSVGGVFYNLQSAHTNDEINDLAQQIAPQLSALTDDIFLNEALFARLKAVHGQRDELSLGTEQSRLLTETYKSFVRGGANLPKDKQARLREINERLSVISLEFGERVLNADNSFEMILSDKSDLSGLPDNVVQSASEAAAEHGHEGEWLFTLNMPSMLPFLTYSDRRDLRERVFASYSTRCDNNDEFDNKAAAKELALLRAERARLLGFDTHAHYVLDESMAKTPDNVYELLDRLWTPAVARAQSERAELQQMVIDAGEDFELEPWDWPYYAEKIKKAKFAFDDEALRPYFELENVRGGMFEMANRLWGLTFEERDDIPKYHEDVGTFVVKDADDSVLAIYLIDSHPRASKRSGAWMSTFRSQHRKSGKKVIPIVINVANVSKPTAGAPALLGLDEVITLFHEFGHALHGMLSDCTYHSLSGTSVPRDFVEMPSQVIENWATEPEMLKHYAHHYRNENPIPDELIDKMKKARLFNQGFATTEYLAASYLDMDWHTLSNSVDMNADEFEKQSLNRIGLIPQIRSRYRSTFFRHIFAGGYSAGYYSYIWAEVVDADAFEAFKADGLFNKETAAKFRKHILERGGTEEPMELYKRFRGREPKIEPLLERRGLT